MNLYQLLRLFWLLDSFLHKYMDPHRYIKILYIHINIIMLK